MLQLRYPTYLFPYGLDGFNAAISRCTMRVGIHRSSQLKIGAFSLELLTSFFEAILILVLHCLDLASDLRDVLFRREILALFPEVGWQVLCKECCGSHAPQHDDDLHSRHGRR